MLRKRWHSLDMSVQCTYLYHPAGPFTGWGQVGVTSGDMTNLLRLMDTSVWFGLLQRRRSLQVLDIAA